MRGNVLTAVSIGLLSLGCVYAQGNGNETNNDNNGQIKKGETLLGQAKNNGKPGGGTTTIANHGGPVMLGMTNIYYIWYGNWSPTDTAKTILTDFAQNIGGSSYFNINTTYTSKEGTHVSNAVHYVGATTDGGSTTLTDAGVQSVVANAINSGRLPRDTNGVYFVLTSQEVNESSGFCTQYCGWHTHAMIGSTDIKYSFIGNAARCPNACAQQPVISPNDNVGADGMASIIAHELEEAVTDPDLNAWYFSNGQENADRCAWTFGTQSTATNGSKYNVTLGTKKYLIQQNWVNNGAQSACAISYP